MVLGAVGVLAGLGGEAAPEPVLTKVGGAALLLVSGDFFIEGGSQFIGKGGAGGVSLIQEGAGAYGQWMNGDAGEATARRWTSYAQLAIGLSGGLRGTKTGNVKIKNFRSGLKRLKFAGIRDFRSLKGLLNKPSKVFKDAYERWRKGRATSGSGNSRSNNFRSPASRHTLSRVNQRTVAKDINSVFESGVDVAGDVRLINQGKATRVGDTYLVNGRTYGVHNGTLFPISGSGIHQLSRPAFKALGVFNQFGDTARAQKILQNMAKTNTALNSDAIDAALRAWRAGRGN